MAELVILRKAEERVREPGLPIPPGDGWHVRFSVVKPRKQGKRVRVRGFFVRLPPVPIGRERALCLGLRFRSLRECVRRWYGDHVCAQRAHDHDGEDELECIVGAIVAGFGEAKRRAPIDRPMAWYRVNVCEHELHEHARSRTFDRFLMWGNDLRERAPPPAKRARRARFSAGSIGRS